MKSETTNSNSTQTRTTIGRFGSDFDPAELRTFYDDHGFFVIEDAIAPGEIEELKAEAVAICRGQRGKLNKAPVINAELSDDDLLRTFLCIHFPHKASERVYAALSHPVVVRALTAAVGPNIKCMQSMLFIKASGKPGQAWHQDEDYIPTRDRSLIGAWIALDRATVENGGLWIIPGSHRPGLLWDQHWHGDCRFDCSFESRDFPYGKDDAVPVEVEAGSVVFFNGYTLHRSLPNKAPAGTFRRALVNHYMRCESFLPWKRPPNDSPVSMAKLDHRDVVVVAGVDPYAHHGYEDLIEPGVRADGRSGCVDWVTNEPLAYNK